MLAVASVKFVLSCGLTMVVVLVLAPQPASTFTLLIFHHTDLGCASHVNASIQEVAEVLSKFTCSPCQVLGGPP